VPKISQLNAAQLAQHAFNVFLFSGRHVTGGRLIYHCLTQDSYQHQALRCLSDFLDSEGTEVFSAVVLEYALSPVSTISSEERRKLDDLHFLAKWSWGFSRHISGQPHLAGDAFKDRAQFDVDSDRYSVFVGDFVKHAGSLQLAFKAAHTLCGAMSGILVHEQFGNRAPIEEVFNSERFYPSSEYSSWLLSRTDELDDLEDERRRREWK